jgi:beta-lactamase regulating signal transducer with metallopeptidase domain
VDRIAEAVVTFVINAAWQTTVMALIGIGIARLLRRAPAHLRFWLVALTLVIAVAAPMTTILLRDASRISPAATTPSSANGVTLSAQQATFAPVRPLNRRVAEIITVVYLAGLLLAVARILFTARSAWSLLTRSQPIADGVRISDDVPSPLTIGRTILLPRSLERSELLPAALAHERAHVRRRDFSMNAAIQLIAIPLWFHPAALLLRREMAELREMACDEEAARQSSPRAYATALIRIAAMTARRDLALGMATTSIERRVALLRRPPSQSPGASLAAIVAIVTVPLALFAACSRTSIAPAIASPTLSGRWTLVPSHSDFRRMVPNAYDTYTQSITQDRRAISVRQHRVANGRAKDQAWRVVTDGKWRAVDGIAGTKGRATWRDGRLSLCLKGPGAHSETAEAWISGGRLICDGDTDRGHFHAVFQRED